MEVVRIDSSTSDDNHLLVSNCTSTHTVCKACFSVILILINFSGKTRFEGLPGGENRFVIHFVVFTVHKRNGPEPALGEGEQGPRPGPRACWGPAEHQRGAPHHAKTRGAGPQRGEPPTAAFLACDSPILGPHNVVC